jgi:hypothetical protein
MSRQFGSGRDCIGRREPSKIHPGLWPEPLFVVNPGGRSPDWMGRWCRPFLRMRSEWRSLEYRSAAYHRAAAARARRLLSEATTRWLKEQLADAIARHEEIAAVIERASELGRGLGPYEAKLALFQAKPPDKNLGVRAIPLRDDRAIRSKRRRLL